ncbi:conserved hypothetical protein [Talaromyces stipitatus ATCC 10500]|uniref:DUF1765-domain-containing protein n=1 Tax=Talaromyces stipitatus (strain ATCC 10500 / CBS 375.48 / QM 6759 / NRRL 1006) TaxID=441959 RepID=B8M4I6_TALSN|nr:uncharacterized protein TSTA_025030 [Talaromyces stipitatus ATCC 10500]EED19181.1 conserved hypothetical protein [Talaromyces stipitatus ATCC 10500]
MAMEVDSVQVQPFPLFQQQEHDALVQEDNKTPGLLQRAASFESTNEDESPDTPVSPGVKRNFSDTSLSIKNEPPTVEENVTAGRDILRRLTLRTSTKPRTLTRRTSTNEAPTITSSVSKLEKSATLNEKPGEIAEEGNKEKPRQDSTPQIVVRPSKSRSVSGKIATLARVSWMSSSRSPSPARDSKKGATSSREQSPTPRSRQTSTKGVSLNNEAKKDNELQPNSNGDLQNKKRASSRRSRRPLSSFVPRSKSVDPPSPSLRSRKSVDQLFAPNLDLPPLPRPPVPSSIPAIEPPRKKDELWTVFRNLEADLQKFHAKSTNLKVNVVRSSLLPFLQRYASHPSFNALRPEDLDRRVNILNKWWTSLLGLLHGKHNQSVSGTDRPVFLEALSGIMTRKEWRIPYQPQNFSAHSSNSSLESSSSDFLAESIFHNVRNIFNQNLLAQMSFVVERMSLRHAPASLVAFCGKACAYAFYFCPGVADMLVRLWNTPSDAYRRLLADPLGYKGTGGRAITQSFAARFPLPIRPLAFCSHIALSRYLRQPPTLPLSAVQIPWQGPWVSRWCGRDSDLFFVFVKYFHILNCDFLPREADASKQLFAPGMLSVQGHLLMVLEDTLYRQSSPPAPENPFAPSAVTFDDFIEGPNTAMSTMHMGMANCHRSMAENRLIILLRDFLSEPSPELAPARRMYFDSFMRVLKTAARKTSLFNHNACFVLCDFVEETAPLVDRYSRKIKEDVFQWPFWLDVCKQLTLSQNSMTEIRLFSFLFSMWKSWTSNKERYHDLCTQFLLHDDYFYTYFSHWNPMVRAYFHRLICWRVARFNENPTPIDSDVYEMLMDKLEQVWAFYLSYNLRARNDLRPRLDAVATGPAPNRRLLIIRSDNQQPSPNSPFISFDRLSTSSFSSGAYQSHGALELDPSALAPDSDSSSTTKRRWNILKSVFGSTANPKPGEVTPPGSVSDENEANPIDSLMGEKLMKSSEENAEDDSIYEPPAPHQPYNFKFSLEWCPQPNRNPQHKSVPKERPLFEPGLPRKTLYYVQTQRSAKALRNSTTTTDESIDPRRDADASTTSTRNSYATTKTSVDETDSTIFENIEASKILRDERIVASKYAGRALAEWAVIVSEYDNFFDRRLREGVPNDELVETPTLSVENLKK